MSEQKIRILDIESVEPNPDQPRKFFDAEKLRELSQSIAARGLMQPIVVRPFPKVVGAKSRYMIIAGERRWRAHKLAGLTEIRAIVETAADDNEVALQAIVENLNRADITPVEEGRAFQSLLDKGWSLEQLARDVGVKEYRILEKTSLLKLTSDLQSLVAAGQLSVTNGQEIAKLPPGLQGKLVAKISRGELRSWGEIKTAVAALLEADNQSDLLLSMPEGAVIAPPAVTQEEVAKLNRMEARIEKVAAMVATGWDDNECVVAKKVNPDRCRLMADRIREIKRALTMMENELRNAAVQAELGAKAA